MPSEVTQRDLLEQNTELTKLVYTTVGKVSDQITAISDRLARLEGRAEGKDQLDQKQVRHANLSLWKVSMGTSSLLSVAALVVGLVH